MSSNKTKLKNKMYGNVSYDFLEMVADYTMKGADGKLITFRNSNGTIKIDELLYTLGFRWDYRNNCASYSILSKAQRFKDEDDGLGVYVRNIEGKPYEVKNMIVYAGEIRENYPYKALYEGKEILIGKFDSVGETKNILEIGDKDEYNKLSSGATEHRTLYDKDGFGGEDE